MKNEETALQHDLDAILAGCEAIGLDGPALRRHVCLDPNARREAIGTTIASLWREVLSLRPDPSTPFWVGAAVPFGHYELIDYLCGSCATIGDSLRQLSRSYRLVSDKIVLRVEGDALEAEPTRGPPEHAAVISMYVSGLILARLRAASTGEMTLVAAQLVGPTDSDSRALERWLEAPCSFGHGACRFVFARGSMALAQRRSRPELRAVLERHAEDLINRRGLDADPLLRVREALRVGVESGDVTLEGVARRLALGERTLQRQLTDAGLSFRQLLAAERREWAVAMLQTRRLGMSEISSRMGYSEQSAFARAFKRWTGLSPTTYRRRLMS